MYSKSIDFIRPRTKYPLIIAATCLTKERAMSYRKHNNANVLGIGADEVTPEQALEIVDTWLTTPFFSSGDERAYLNRYLQTVRFAIEAGKRYKT
ncbi:MAG: RpiB/LacA/LacB family sugar-phosphate isomerase [Candidatus Aenigmatarchaeota archaeon]